MTFNTILPGAWELTQEIPCELFSLQVPTAWQQVAKSLAQNRVKLLGKGYPSVPVYSLDPIIAASFPQIIQTSRNAWQRSGVPWILATEKADLSELPEFIKDWLREEFSECLGAEAVELSLKNLDNGAWRWEDPQTYSLRRQPENKYEDVRFQALPDYLAREFLKQPQVGFGEHQQYELTFYRVASLNQGAELMSWPPHPVPLIKRNQQVGTAAISFVIRFKLQTVPWRNQPIIYHQLSIRRWIQEPFEQFPYRGATAYFGAPRRWLDGVHQPFCFISLQIKQKITPTGREPRWSQTISELLKLNDSPLPDPQTLASEPAYHWSPFGEEPVGVQGAIAYDTRHFGKVPCLPGVSPRDLASLDQAIQKKIEEGFPIQRAGEAVRVSGNSVHLWKPDKFSKKKDTSAKKRDDLSTPMLQPKIAASATFRIPEHSPYTILILWETQDSRDALIQEICELLYLSPKGEAQTYEFFPGFQGEEMLYEGPCSSLQIKTQHVQDLTQRLDLDHPSVQGRNRQEKRVNLLDERIQQIASSLPKPEGLSGALIEIKPKQSFFPSESDPKLALRIGAMKAGYVNQHIHALTALKKSGEEYVTKNAANRVQKAVSDLLRQFGILPTPLIDPSRDGIELDTWLTCFYALRRTRKTTASNAPSMVGLIVRVNSVSGIVEVTTPSLFPRWVLYPVGLGCLVNEKWNSDFYSYEVTDDNDETQSSSDKKREQQFFSDFVTRALRDCLNTPVKPGQLPRVLFMTEAQNARKLLAWLQNPNLPVNALPDELKRDMTESEIARLWVVRLRVANNGEVPVGIVKDSPGSRTSGVFHWQHVCEAENTSLYFSLRKLLTTEQGVLRQLQSRLDDGSRQAATPRMLEIAVVHSPDVDQNKLACFVHNLRDRWPYFADEVSLPLPFRFATLAKEYAVSAKDERELEDLESEEAFD